MIYVVINNKGGEGKSTISFNVLPLLITNKDNFEVVEIDQNNKTALKYENSELLKGKCRTITVDEADDNLSLIFFEALSGKKDIIIDAGGGDDTNRVLEYLEEQPGQNLIKYIIPLTPGGDGENLENTYNRIKNKENVLIVLNGYRDKKDIKKDFIDWFGDSSIGWQGLNKKIKAPTIEIPFTNAFKIAKKYKMTIADLAKLAEDLSPDEAYEVFTKEAGNEPAKYQALYEKYKASMRTLKTLDEIRENLKGNAK